MNKNRKVISDEEYIALLEEEMGEKIYPENIKIALWYLEKKKSAPIILASMEEVLPNEINEEITLEDLQLIGDSNGCPPIPELKGNLDIEDYLKKRKEGLTFEVETIIPFKEKGL